MMQWTGVNELREKFLAFFEQKGHKRLESFPLIPQEDHSLLLINSGMAPMKKWFLGQSVPPSKRVTTCQKCIRTPDIERVGKTCRHGTFFEMLGNISFGDYFKEEATAWAWEFVTQELEIPVERLFISIYEKDDEAYEIWTKKRGVDPSHIVRLGKEDNFWEIGSGPCGPCSEIYFDRGPETGCQSPDCGVGCDCDRFVEFWNLVFSQYNSDGNGHYEPMERPNIDTGMGLERLACILQEVDNLFEVDTVQNIMTHICRIAHTKYHENPTTDIYLRVITDHIRSSVFLVADGVIPGNEGREYVLRRLIRRAARNGKLLGITRPFLYEVAQTVVAENKAAYPRLTELSDYIQQIIQAEEENFHKILERGMNLLNQTIDRLDARMEDTLSAEECFALCDTHGFPFDLIKEFVEERNMQVDEAGYRELMEQQRTRARNAAASDSVAWSEDTVRLQEPATEFIGYETFSCEASLLHIFDENTEIETAKASQTVRLIFDRTPFYAESGGQVADHGIFTLEDAVVNISDCQKIPSGQYVHFGKVMTGQIQRGQNGTLQIDGARRAAIARNHTAAHLLQRALRNVLGNHVHQSGQLVDNRRLRFDFNHFEPLSANEIKRISQEVNDQILSGLPVQICETDIQTAKKRGAMALFGEKYGEIVRMVNAGGYSIELCGGTHVDNTAKIGLFQILSESSASAGIRRIEAVTGSGVLNLICETQSLLHNACQPLKLSNPQDLPQKIKALSAELKEAKREIDSLNSRLASNQLEQLFSDGITEVDGIRVASTTFSGVDNKALRTIGDRFKEKSGALVAAFATIKDGKGTLLVICTPEAIKRGARAGDIVRELAALAGGKGGGRPDSAMAGIREIFKLDEALAQLPAIVQKWTHPDQEETL